MESWAYKRRNNHGGGIKFILSGELTARLPKLDKAGLEVLLDFGNGKDKSPPFKFFEEVFPITSQYIILKEDRISMFTRLRLFCFLSWARRQVNCSTFQVCFLSWQPQECWHWRLV